MAGLWAVAEAVEQEAGLVEAFLQRTTLRMVAMQLAFRGGEDRATPHMSQRLGGRPWQVCSWPWGKASWQRDVCKFLLRGGSGLAGLDDDMPSRDSDTNTSRPPLVRPLLQALLRSSRQPSTWWPASAPRWTNGRPRASRGHFCGGWGASWWHPPPQRAALCARWPPLYAMTGTWQVSLCC